MTASKSHPGFAPLGREPDAGEQRMQLKGVVFDMDGTLCEPQNYMFGEMRSALGITKAVDILDHIHALQEPERTEAFSKIQAIERRAMEKQVPQPGLATLMEFLDRCGVKRGICTRNFDAPVNHLLQNHIPSSLRPFEAIITRDFHPPKPAPEGIWHIAKVWGLEPGNALPVLMVGDSEDDMAAGRSAGALTVLLRSEGKEALERDARTDVVVGRLDELVGILEGGIRPR